MARLEGKVAVITGGSTGIGLATATRFVAEGASVYITGRRTEELDRAVRALGKNVVGVQGDIAKNEDLDRLYSRVREEKGHIDVLIANAGIGSLAPLGQITDKQIDDTFNVNVKGTLFTVQKALPLLRKGSSVVLVGSTTGIMGTPAFSVYSASKAAIRNLARSWALDLKGTGIRINVLSPGPTETPALQVVAESTGVKDAMLAGLADGTALGRIGDASEIAAAALFLATSDSSFMTGSEIFVDGGYAQV